MDCNPPPPPEGGTLEPCGLKESFAVSGSEAPPLEGMGRRYWKGEEELQNDAKFVQLKNNEFAEHLPLDEIVQEKSNDATVTPRRDFLKFLGFSVAAASLAACEAPVRKTIPYLVRPEQITPGASNWYASSYHDGYDYCPVIVKTREGRPVLLRAERADARDGGERSHVLSAGRSFDWRHIAASGES